MLGVKSHSVISRAASHGITPYNLIRSRIDDGKNILILQIHIDFLYDRVVLRHACFTVEVQGLDDLVFGNVNDRFCLPSFVGNIEFVKRDSVGASIRFCLGLHFLDNFHLLQINNTDCVVTCIRGVDLL